MIFLSIDEDKWVSTRLWFSYDNMVIFYTLTFYYCQYDYIIWSLTYVYY